MPMKYSGGGNIAVSIKHNKYPPNFARRSYQVTMKEDANPGQGVVGLNAQDGDSQVSKKMILSMAQNLVFVYVNNWISHSDGYKCHMQVFFSSLSAPDFNITLLLIVNVCCFTLPNIKRQ